MPTIENAQKDIQTACQSLSEFLLEKNRRYGNSALEPVGIFAKAIEPNDQLTVRIDDKLARIRNSKELRKNDVVDPAGYLILVMIANGWTDLKDQID